MVSFDSTVPMHANQLMRVSGFQRYLDAGADERLGPPSTRLSSLNPSLMQDLMRFERDDGSGSELLEVLAASLRHGRPLLVHAALGDHVLPLTLFPAERLVHCPMTRERLLETPLNQLAVLHVEPALLHPPGAARGQEMAAASHECLPLALLSWELALRGLRDTLLPELPATAAYRVTPGADLRQLALAGTLAAAVHRLRREPSTPRDIARWAGFDRERAIRLLNGLYLQSALIVSRSVVTGARR